MPRGARTTRGLRLGRRAHASLRKPRMPHRPRHPSEQLARRSMSGAGERSSSQGRACVRTRAWTASRAAEVRSGRRNSRAWAGGQQLDRQNAAGVGHRSRRLVRGGHAHRHVVFLVGRGGDGVDARGMREALVLRGQGGGRDWAIMRPDWRPPSRARNAGRSESVGLTSRSMRRSLIAPSSATAIASMSAAMATGSPWKLPPESSSPVSANTIGLSVAAFSSMAIVRSA